MDSKKNTRLHFEDIRFSSVSGGVRAHFLNNYYFDLDDKDLGNIGAYSVDGGDLILDAREKRARNKFNLLLEKGLQHLTHRIGDKHTLYIHGGSGLALIGTNEFGLVDRGSNIIEVKPLTGCNLNCTFCSVGEGKNNKTDIIVEEKYLAKEFGKLARLKKHPVEANIGPQGEPLLYPQLVELVKDLKKEGASIISINTNGTLLSEQLIDELHIAGLDRINLSLHALDQKKANALMGGVQPIDKITRVVAYCHDKIDVLLAPVLIAGYNDDQLDELIEFSKTIKNKRWPSIGIQNFLEYPGGRNPGAKVRPWKEFYHILKEKEKEHGVKLIVEENVFTIYKDESPPKPFKKGEVISVELLALGRHKHELLGVAKERTITVKNCDEELGKTIKVKLLRDKHNIYTAIKA